MRICVRVCFPDRSTRECLRAMNLCPVALASWIKTPRAACGGNANTGSVVRSASSVFFKDSWRRCTSSGRFTRGALPFHGSTLLKRSTRMKHRIMQVAAAIALALAVGTVAAGGATNVTRATLDNGLRVVIVRDTLAPVVATEMNYMAGSDEVTAGFPGTAHAVEHMMFRGSPGLSKDQLAAIAANMGGAFNADTTQSVTQYYFVAPSQDLNVALHVQSLRMRGWARARRVTRPPRRCSSSFTTPGTRRTTRSW